MASRVFPFDVHLGLGAADLKALLGSKGAGLSAMTRAGLPVPPGFTITTRACLEYLANGRLEDKLMDEVLGSLAALERATGRGFGDPAAPLLLSVRSGAPVSMPGMMDTVLNLGMTQETVAGLSSKFGGDLSFARDSYRRFLESYGAVVLGIPFDAFQAAAADATDSVIAAYRELFRQTGTEVPGDPREQLRAAVAAVFRSWNSERAKVYRQLESIPDDLGTAVTVQAMVFGNLDGRSGTGVAFTRDPNTGERALYGDFLFQAQGEDVVSGRRATRPLRELAARLPDVAAALSAGCELLERRLRDMADIEFTVESGRLYFLQMRRGKRAAVAAVRIAVEMAEEGLISREEAVARITARDLTRLSRPYLDPTTEYVVLTTGLNASPGVATGAICTDADRVHELRLAGGVILVRPETSPSDVHGMALATGILTTRGGLVSHAAVVARDMDTPAVVGAASVTVDAAGRTVLMAGTVLRDGDVITIDGSTGEVVLGSVPTVEPSPGEHITTLLTWADTIAGPTAAYGAAPHQRLQAAHAVLEGRVSGRAP